MGYILAFYLILLSAVPCCAFDNCPDDKAGQTTKHQKGDQDCGNCSPFFSCEGCAAATIAHDPPQFHFSLPEIKSVFIAYLQSPLPEVDYDFWQPPKLS
jgi:hypothetical protein